MPPERVSVSRDATNCQRRVLQLGVKEGGNREIVRKIVPF